MAVKLRGKSSKPIKGKREKTKNKPQTGLFVGFKKSESGFPSVAQFAYSSNLEDVSFSNDETADAPPKKQSKPNPQKVDSDRTDDKFGFNEAIDGFVQQMESLARGVPFINSSIPLLGAMVIDRQVKPFVTKNARPLTVAGTEPGVEVFELPIEKYQEFKKKLSEYHQLKAFGATLPGISLVGLVSAYDSYLSDLLKSVFASQPEWVASSEKSISPRQLFDSASIDELKTMIVEKEVEAILRKSHADQINWLEAKLGIPLTKELKCWPEFIEICERRNLFTHSGGIVSRLYLDNCKSVGIDVSPKVVIGKKLKVNGSYFDRALEVFYEVGVKLGFVVWRKLVKTEKEFAERCMSNVAYELIVYKKYKLAIQLLEFSTAVPALKDWYRLAMTVNLANATRLLGDGERAKELLGKIDWEVCGLEFRISASCIHGDHKKAVELMQLIGKDGAVAKEDYHNWPVFEGFRSTQEFRSAYKAIFKTDFSADEVLSDSKKTVTH